MPREAMTPERQCKAKPTDRSGLYLMVMFILSQTCGQSLDHMTIKRQLRELSETVAAGAPRTAGRQQGVSAPECPPIEGPVAGSQVEQDQWFGWVHGRLAQSVEQRTFNPLPTSTQYQPEAKLRGNPADFDARSASGCSRLHAERVSAGCQEVER